jgi:D-beta-D-heptose 7-phosphate kinase/D-beta-D-heptose 1-phosphate adenosyltransferase
MREKILNRYDLKKALEQCGNKRVVFTNGCFDILHAGHVTYLEDASGLGDILVVAINSDDSVRRLKGPTRPINPECDRALVLAALESVTYVTFFDEDTPYELIKLFQPDVLVKGGDWKPEQIVGSDIVQAKGGMVLSLPYLEGRSTTGIVEKMQQKELA